jgi:oxygen-dependent protoporphyrinogen oxidase
VDEIIRLSDGRFSVRGIRRGAPAEVTADAVVVAVPARVAGQLIRPLSAAAADVLGSIFYPPVSEVFLGFPAAAMTRPLDGFGYLIPAKEERRILGTIWSSSLFPGRAPQGHVALTTFVGGSRQPRLAGIDDGELIRIVLEELRAIMGVAGDPVYTNIIRWERAIPQYNLGYQAAMKEVDSLETRMPGLFFCGNFRGGIAVGDCVMSGERTARRIAGTVQGSVQS